MKRKRNNRWTGERRRPDRRAVYGRLRPLWACLMAIAGVALVMTADKTTAPRSATSLTAGRYVTSDENVSSLWQTFIEAEGGDGKADADASSSDPMNDLIDYAKSFSDIDFKALVNYASAQEKLAADEEYRERMKNARVVSSNRALYLDGYSYASPQYILGEDYTRLNSEGAPLSQYAPPPGLELGEDGVPLYYSYYIDGVATAYCSAGTTATGTGTYQGTVAVDPREIPYGTEMWITSLDGRYVYGYCRAEDTGGFIYYSNGATVDLFMHSYDDCMTWGRRDVRIYILSR